MPTPSIHEGQFFTGCSVKNVGWGKTWERGGKNNKRGNQPLRVYTLTLELRLDERYHLHVSVPARAACASRQGEKQRAGRRVGALLYENPFGTRALVSTHALLIEHTIEHFVCSKHISPRRPNSIPAISWREVSPKQLDLRHRSALVFNGLFHSLLCVTHHLRREKFLLAYLC